MGSSFNETVTFDRRTAEQLMEYSRTKARQEACGLLFGNYMNSEITVTRIQGMRNVSSRPETHFAFDPGEWVSALYGSFNTGSENVSETLVGIFHSHPSDDAVPSETDRQLQWEFPTYAIVSLYGEKPSIRCYRLLQKERWREQRVRIRNDSDAHTAHPNS